MEMHVYLDHYLEGKRQQRASVFDDAASTSLLMGGVKYLCRDFYHLFDLYCRCFMRLRLRGSHSAATVWHDMGRYYADAIDTYHVLWVIVTFLLYLVGWQISFLDGDSWLDYCLWIVPLFLCVYRVFEILAALVEMYFRASETKHHQFRILLHSALHYLAAGFAFALFYLCVDWAFYSFSSKNATTDEMESQFYDWSEPIFNSLMTIVAFGGYDEPEDWIGKLLTLLELSLGFMLVTFIFLNITQIWLGDREAK
jgi:hypothetical protein